MHDCMGLNSMLCELWVSSLTNVYLVAGMEMPMGMPLVDLPAPGSIVDQGSQLLLSKIHAGFH